MSDDINPGLGIERLRLAAGISKKELALATGIDEGNLNRLISGKQWPTKARLQALADYFRVPVFEIFRVAEQGATYTTRDLRKDQIVAAVAQLTDEQISNAFRQTGDETPQRAPSKLLPAPTTTTERDDPDEPIRRYGG